MQKVLILIFSVLVALDIHSQTTNQNGQVFKFSFPLNKPLTYSIELNTRAVTDQTISGRNTLKRTTSAIRYKIRLTAIQNKQNGITTVHYEPFDFEQDLDATNPQGEMTSSVRGLDVIAKQNGVITINSARGIGLSLARTIKLAVVPSLLSGTLDFTPTGTVTNPAGDLPFVDHWKEMSQQSSGFFHLIFPTNALAVFDSWTDITPPNLPGVTLDGGPIGITNVITRQPDSETSSGTSAYFTFSCSDHRENLTGSIDGPGQRNSVVLPERTETVDGNFHFDQKAGRLIDFKSTDKLNDAMNSTLQGGSFIGRTDGETEITIKLLSP